MRSKILTFFLSSFFYSQTLFANDFSFRHNLIKGIGGIIALLLLSIFLLFANLKNKRAKKKIAISNSIDPFWNYDDMIKFSKKTFEQLQNAWSERNMDLVRDRVTDELYESYKKQLDWMKVKKEKNFIEDIRIKKTRIIGDEDYKDIEKDTFTAFISGKFVNYTMSERTGEIFENSKKKKSSFMTFYYFQRHDERWLLNKIETRDLVFKIYKTRQLIEE
jgi:Tim44-like domain